MSDDLLKWVDDPEAFEGIATALRDAREDLPSDEQVAALATKLGPLLGGGGPGGAGGPGSPGSGGTGSAGAGSTGSVGGSATAAGVTGGTKLIVGMLGGAVLVASIATWGVVTDRRRVEHIVGSGGGSSTTQSENAAAEPEAAQASEAAEVPRGLDTPEETLGVPEAPRGHTEGQEHAPAKQATRPRAPAATDDEAPERIPELTLLQQAQDALGRAPGSALALADRHARDYPRGALAQEREVVAVDALLRLGRRSDAEARASRFRAVNPGSSQLRRIERLLAQ
ncbi:MAG: hypothetical protein DRJ42_01390 [Deltaproteobacteria bacterium]|nr:MAG: hypothetical protein DRJ42_01390 [Deltaproteobacteria bacterium]